MSIEILDCTLRDGCYICSSNFGSDVISGITLGLQNANIDIIELGWLKNNEYVPGTAYFHTPKDAKEYFDKKRSPNTTHIAMIDWDRYNLDTLPPYDGDSIDGIRVVFPRGKHDEGTEVGRKIKEKGYKLFLQAANTYAYSNEELVALANAVNTVSPVSISIVDTFGAMYPEDLTRIATVLDKHLNPEIKIGFHSHNNQQLSFALSIQFIDMFKNTKRNIIIDSTLMGMGRGPGNTTTELLVNYLITRMNMEYNLQPVLSTIDNYLIPLKNKYDWGYSVPFFCSGAHCAHVNNVAYLIEKKNATNLDIWNTFEKENSKDRINYNYDVLEKAWNDRNN